MARKRMISPEIWENEDFGVLSPLAKLLFIGMISLADDDGKGIASPQLLKSNLFPFDDKLRSTDIDKTLDEIGNYMSTKSSAGDIADEYRPLNERASRLSIHFYKVEGKRYYKFTNWKKWQSINRPSPSRFPDPPEDGVGGDIESDTNFSDNSLNTHGVLTEGSLTKKKIEREIETLSNERESARVSAREELSLSPLIEIDGVLSKEQVDTLRELLPIIEKTPYLQKWKFASKYLKYAARIRAEYYKDYREDKESASKDATGYEQHNYTEEQLKHAFVNFDNWE